MDRPEIQPTSVAASPSMSRHQPSPLTGRTDTECLAIRSPLAISERWRLEMGIDVGDAFRALPSIEFWRCGTTGLHWYAPAEAAGDGALYAQLERFNWYYMADKWEFRAALQALTPRDHVLEVGAGVGHFLRAARDHGMFATGVELNPSAAARARSRGFEILECDLSELATSLGTRYDAICAFQVLEHVPEPRRLIEGMLGLLRPGGRLVLSVPNAAVMRVIDPDRDTLLNQPPHHLSHWDAGVFKALEQLLPVRVIKLRREPLQPYHRDWFVSAYCGVLRRRVSKPVARVLLHPRLINQIRRLLSGRSARLVPGHTLLAVLEHAPHA